MTDIERMNVEEERNMFSFTFIHRQRCFLNDWFFPPRAFFFFLSDNSHDNKERYSMYLLMIMIITRPYLDYPFISFFFPFSLSNKRQTLFMFFLDIFMYLINRY